MAKISILAGTTSKLVDVFIQDSTSTTGAGLTGLTNGSSGLTWYYYREGAAGSTQVTSIASMTLGTWTSKGFIVIDGTNMPGCYQLGVPDAAIAAGAKSVIMVLKGATNMVPLVLEIELTAVDNQDAVRYGMTALPNVASGSNGAIPTTGTGSNQISVTSGRVDAGKINGVSTSSVTTINANVGTTQPVNFTGTGGSALVETDVIDYAGTVQTGGFDVGLSAASADFYAQIAAAGPPYAISNQPVLSATTNTVTINTAPLGGPSANDTMVGQICFTNGGDFVDGSKQARLITGWNGTTGVFTISPPWTVIPNTNCNVSVYPAVRADLGFIEGTALASHTSGYVPAEITSNVKKNQALNAFTFTMTDSTTHTPLAGLAVTAQRSLDGGAFAACANTVSGIANGDYKINLAASDLNANTVMLRFTATGADDLNILLVTQP